MLLNVHTLKNSVLILKKFKVKNKEAVAQRCYVQNLLLKISQIHRKIPVPESLFNKVAGMRPTTLLKKRFWHRYFPVNFAEFLRKPLLTKPLLWPLVKNIQLTISIIISTSISSSYETKKNSLSSSRKKLKLYFFIISCSHSIKRDI